MVYGLSVKPVTSRIVQAFGSINEGTKVFWGGCAKKVVLLKHEDRTLLQKELPTGTSVL